LAFQLRFSSLGEQNVFTQTQQLVARRIRISKVCWERRGIGSALHAEKPLLPSFKQSQIDSDQSRWITGTALSAIAKASGSDQSRIEAACKGRITSTTLSAIAKASGSDQSRIEVACKGRITGTTLSAIAKASGSDQSRIEAACKGRITSTTLSAANSRPSCLSRYLQYRVAGWGIPATACRLKGCKALLP